MDEPDKTFLIVALDLLSGLTQGLKGNMATLINPPNTPEGTLPPLIQLLQNCLNVSRLLSLRRTQSEANLSSSTSQHPEASVRQSAYALLGDMAISCHALSPFLPLYLPRIVKEIADQVATPKYDEVSVCNNAAWAVGEIAMQCQSTGASPLCSQNLRRARR